MVQILFNGFLLGLFHIVEDIAGLMCPAALYGNVSVDEGQGSLETFPSIGDNQFEVLPVESTAVEIVQEAFPMGLFLRQGVTEVNHFLFRIGADVQDH